MKTEVITNEVVSTVEETEVHLEDGDKFKFGKWDIVVTKGVTGDLIMNIKNKDNHDPSYNVSIDITDDSSGWIEYVNDNNGKTYTEYSTEMYCKVDR